MSWMPPDAGTDASIKANVPSEPAEMGRMQRFVAELLSAKGALVEPVEPQGLEVLAPPPVRDALGLAELDRLGFSPALPPGAQRVGLEGDWLDRLGKLLGEHGRAARRVLAAEPRAPGDPERILEHELALDNAAFRLLDVTPAWTRYLVLDFRYSAISDEKRAGVLRLGINLATSGLPDGVLARVLPWLDAQRSDPELPAGAVLPSSWDRPRVLDLAKRGLPPRLHAALAPFLKGLHRRFERDRERLHLYHNDLYRDARRRSIGLAENDPACRRDELRASAIEREYRAKLEDLARQYAMRVTVEWVQTLDLAMPVQRFAVQIRRRKAERVIQLDWNPLARLLESPPCEATAALERPRLVCDEALHLVVPAGLAPCPACGKAFCRACHRDRCPKCAQEVQRPALHLAGGSG
jgi:hypothetical protein